MSLFLRSLPPLFTSIPPFEGEAIAQQTSEIKAVTGTPSPIPPLQVPQVDVTTAALFVSCGALLVQFLKNQLESFSKKSEVESDRNVSNQHSTQKMIETVIAQQQTTYVQQQQRYDEMLNAQRGDLSKMIEVLSENNQLIKRVLELLNTMEAKK